MANVKLVQKVNKEAGDQFLGTEFRASTNKKNVVLEATQLVLKMGPELKTWKIIHTYKNALNETVETIIRQSTSGGVPAATTDTDVALSGNDFGIDLFPGEQIQIETTGATAAMNARITYKLTDHLIEIH